MDVTFASGYSRRSSRNMPLPTTWFGRQANGWAQMMFGVPVSMSSIISAVSSQPSPAVVPSETIDSARWG